VASNDSDKSTEEEVTDFLNAFTLRIMKNALMSVDAEGIPPPHAQQFEALGLISNLEMPPVPEDIAEILSRVDHPSRAQTAPGPLIFVREADSVSIVDTGDLLLHPDRLIRDAAVRHLMTGRPDEIGWLTPFTGQVLSAKLTDLQSDEVDTWRPAALEVMPLIRDDYFADVARLNQSLSVGDNRGFSEYMTRLVRPKYEVLAHLRPQLYSATEQREEFGSWIAECSNCPTLYDALTRYYDRCGCVPLAKGLDAGAVAVAWQAKHQDQPLTWQQLSSWAEHIKTPLAKYHAVVVALCHPIQWEEESALGFWTTAVEIIKSGDNKATDGEVSHEWRLFCKLAAHFAQHIETLHPGQHGERVGCYALWLSEKIGRTLVEFNIDPKSMLPGLERQQINSQIRWAIARSPVEPSPLRFACLHLTSIWSMSLLGRLSSASVLPPIPDGKDAAIHGILRRLVAYLISSPLGLSFGGTTPIFAFQDAIELGNLDSIPGATATECESVREIVAFRQRMAEHGSVADCLNRLLELSETEQLLFISYLRTVMLSTKAFDDVASTWIVQTTTVVEVLRKAPEKALIALVAVLQEVQQRQRADVAARIPQMFAYAVESLDDKDRAEYLWGEVCLLSINCGIVSPIQRLAVSKWSTEFLSLLRTWRDGLLDVAKDSEPWIGGRVRSTSAAISRLIGPRQLDGHESPVAS